MRQKLIIHEVFIYGQRDILFAQKTIGLQVFVFKIVRLTRFTIIEFELHVAGAVFDFIAQINHVGVVIHFPLSAIFYKCGGKGRRICISIGVVEMPLYFFDAIGCDLAETTSSKSCHGKARTDATIDGNAGLAGVARKAHVPKSESVGFSFLCGEVKPQLVGVVFTHRENLRLHPQ